MLFQCLFRQFLLTQGAAVVLGQPLLNARRVEVMLLIARERCDFVALGEVHHADWAGGLRILVCGVEAGLVHLLNEFRGCSEPLRSL